MSTRKTIDLEVTLENGDKVIRQFEDLGKGVKKLADSNEKLDATFDDVFNGMAPLTTRMGEAEDRLYELALAGDTTSKEYQGLLAKVGEYRKVQIQTDLAVDAAATTLSQKLGGALTGATSGFAAVQGVMGLVGSESETLEKTLLKVQSALALQQGVQGVLEYSKSIGLAGKATKVFNLIVKANPLALLATALIAIIGYFAVFTDAIDVAIQGLKNFGDAIGLTNFAEQELEEKRQERHKQEKQRQLDEIALLKQKQRIAEEDFQRELAFQESLGKSTARLRKARVLEQIADAEARAKMFKGLVFEKEAQRTLIELRTELNNINKEIRAENKEASDEKKTQDNEEIARQKELEEIERQRLQNIEQLNNELLDEIAEVEEENFARTLTEQENEVRAVEEKYFRLIELARQNGLDTNELETARLNELNDIKLKFGEQALEQQEALDAQAEANRIKDKEEAQQALNMKLQATSQVFGAIGGLATQLAKGDEKRARKAFNINKAAGIAQATISTGQGIMAELADPKKVATFTNYAAAAAMAIAGATQIAAITATKFQPSGGGGGGVGGASSPSLSEGAQAPSFNVVGDSGINQLAQLQQQPMQAFVVSGEVTTAQALDRNRIQNASL